MQWLALLVTPPLQNGFVDLFHGIISTRQVSSLPGTRKEAIPQSVCTALQDCPSFVHTSVKALIDRRVDAGEGDFHRRAGSAAHQQDIVAGAEGQVRQGDRRIFLAVPAAFEHDDRFFVAGPIPLDGEPVSDGLVLGAGDHVGAAGESGGRAAGADPEVTEFLRGAILRPADLRSNSISCRCGKSCQANQKQGDQNHGNYDQKVFFHSKRLLFVWFGMIVKDGQTLFVILDNPGPEVRSSCL